MQAEAFARLKTLPRRPMAFLPTPLLPAPSLQAALGSDAPPILMKMDDWTGFALGGNKVRKLEFFLGDDGEKADTLITCGGPQSNHCRVTAATAAQLGMRCILVVNGQPPDPLTGNALLMDIFGAEVRPVESQEDRTPAMEAAAREEVAEGRKAVVIPLGASTPLGAMGYVQAALELDQQMEDRGGWPPALTWIFISSSSCGTLAGLALGFTLLGRKNVRLVGVSPDVTEEEIRTVSREIAMGAGKLLGWEGDLLPDLITPDDRFVGDGYGIPSEASKEATRIFGSKAGVVLDPVYTSKAGAGFIHWIREGKIPVGDSALFWHTGGAPALFT
jgi:1-aminocyclopropane-1-carboxylate deaminase/D-cysteine desulfhydrase-like pyridoxal-dependent ACC family enzyme